MTLEARDALGAKSRKTLVLLVKTLRRLAEIPAVRDVARDAAKRYVNLAGLSVRADDGTRTHDTWLGKPVLYQLSYVRAGPILPPCRSVTPGRAQAVSGLEQMLGKHSHVRRARA